jgi:hypothetical protein
LTCGWLERSVADIESALEDPRAQRQRINALAVLDASVTSLTDCCHRQTQSQPDIVILVVSSAPPPRLRNGSRIRIHSPDTERSLPRIPLTTRNSDVPSLSEVCRLSMCQHRNIEGKLSLPEVNVCDQLCRKLGQLPRRSQGM